MSGPEGNPAEALRAVTAPDAAQPTQPQPTVEIESTEPTIGAQPTIGAEPTIEAQPTVEVEWTSPDPTVQAQPPTQAEPTVQVPVPVPQVSAPEGAGTTTTPVQAAPSPAASPGLTKAAAGVRGIRRWSRSPGGRYAIPLMVILLLLAGVAVAGGWLVPRTAPRPTAGPPHSTEPSAPASGAPTLPGNFPVQPTPSAPSGAPQAARQVDALLGWAQHIGPTVDIPPVALAAYGYAQVSVASAMPGCHLSWTTLAGIGKVESNHGSANGAVLQPNGMALPPILGDALNGQGGRKLVTDTDQGRLDSDTTYDRAVGPMQFLPSTWQQVKADGDQDGQEDPNDINDAALAAANYLCGAARDLSTSNGWWGAILSYNDVQAYAQSVFDQANHYGQLSKTVT